MAETLAEPGGGAGAGEKGLKGGSLGLLSTTVIGVASTAPGYSLAASLGLVIAAVGLQAPSIMWVAFVPMAFTAAAYFYMNRADPDCGTTFSWGTRALGPSMGWIGGWAIIVAETLEQAIDVWNRYAVDATTPWVKWGSWLVAVNGTETGQFTVEIAPAM